MGPLNRPHNRCSCCKKPFVNVAIQDVLRPKYRSKSQRYAVLTISVDADTQESKNYCQYCAPIIRDLLEEKLEFFK